MKILKLPFCDTEMQKFMTSRDKRPGSMRFGLLRIGSGPGGWREEQKMWLKTLPEPRPDLDMEGRTAFQPPQRVHNSEMSTPRSLVADHLL